MVLSPYEELVKAKRLQNEAMLAELDIHAAAPLGAAQTVTPAKNTPNREKPSSGDAKGRDGAHKGPMGARPSPIADGTSAALVTEAPRS
jgi:hypothetical protein